MAHPPTPLRPARELNQQERWKLERHPLEVERAVRERYAAEGPEAIATVPGEVERLKWVGIYPQRQGGDAFMLRVKIPGGRLAAGQARRIGELAERFADGPEDHPVWGNRYCDLTTRQTVQMHWLRIEDIPEIWDRLAEVGLTSVQACGDGARNVTCCPVAGIDPDEAFDATPQVQAISAFFTGNRDYANLPRKFKMSVTGCVEDCARTEINDIGLWPARAADGTLGFNLLVGGGLSDGPRMASDLDVFVGASSRSSAAGRSPSSSASSATARTAVLARMRYLVQELGPEGFRAELAARADFELEPAGEELTRAFRGDHVGVHEQRPPDRASAASATRPATPGDPLHYVGASVTVGRLTGGELIELAELAERYGDGEVRLSADQNVILAGIPQSRIDEVLDAAVLRRHSPRPGPFSRGVIACTGSEFCRFAIIETKEAARAWAAELDRRHGASLGEGEVIRLHVSGCPASCAQPQVADIGLRGDTAHMGERIVEAVDIGLGGSLGLDAAFADWVSGALPVSGVSDALVSGARSLRRRSPACRALCRVGAARPQRQPARPARGTFVTTLLPAPAETVGLPARNGIAHPPALPEALVEPQPPFRFRAEMNGIAEAPGKVWFFELAAAVIDADRCVQCGACIAACPTDSIGVSATGIPELVKMCTGCALCWDFCPRGGLAYETTFLDAADDPPGAAFPLDPVPNPAPIPVSEPATARPAPAPATITGGGAGDGLGRVRLARAARVRDTSRFRARRAQDGGVVTAVLLAALERGAIDGAVVASEDPHQPWRGIPLVATTPEQIAAAGGSFYNQTMALGALDLERHGLARDARVAVVGTPCEIQGIRALQAHSWRRGASRVDAVVLTIALLCTKSFDYGALVLGELAERRGIDLAAVGKVDVIHGRLVVEDRDGGVLVDEPVKAFHGAALKGCDECADFLGRAADLSVGSVGSAPGWSSVLVRTEAGEAALSRLGGDLELAELERPEALRRLDDHDRSAALAALRRSFDPAGPRFVSFAEHEAAYAGSERCPVWRGR